MRRQKFFVNRDRGRPGLDFTPSGRVPEAALVFRQGSRVEGSWRRRRGQRRREEQQTIRRNFKRGRISEFRASARARIGRDIGLEKVRQAVGECSQELTADGFSPFPGIEFSEGLVLAERDGSDQGKDANREAKKHSGPEKSRPRDGPTGRLGLLGGHDERSDYGTHQREVS